MNKNHDIQLLKTSDLSGFHYSNPEGIAVVMPCIDTEKGMTTARNLSRRAGMPCKVLIVHDSRHQGFIKTLNDAALKISARHIVYLAEDAYPGRNWLVCAYHTLEKSGKGLLAFNDGKWKGRIASFGMVRTKWVKSLYDGKLFYPGYESHGADNELTVIARVRNMHAYNPDCTLVEYDPVKDFGGSNPRDRELFQTRFVNGFDGMVPLKKLKKLAKEYNVKMHLKNHENLTKGYNVICEPQKNRIGISIIIHARSGATPLDRLLSAFYQVNTYQPVEFIVIDNTLNDQTRKVVAKYAANDSIRHLKRNENESFAISNNLAVKKANYPYLLFLSTDIIYTSDVLPLAVAQLQDANIGVVGIRLDDSPPSLPPGNLPGVRHTGIKFVHDPAHEFYRPLQLSLKTIEEAKKVPSSIYPAVAGAFLLCRKGEFEKLDGFCEEYDYGFEDIDFCLRIGSKLKKKCLCINEVSLGYVGGNTRHMEPGVAGTIQVKNLQLLNKRAGGQISKFPTQKTGSQKSFHISQEHAPFIKQTSTVFSKSSPNIGQRILYIIHDGGGGMVYTSFDLMKSMNQRNTSFLLKTGKKEWKLYEYINNEIACKHKYDFKIDWKEIVDINNERKAALDDIYNKLNPTLIHLRVLIGNGPYLIDFFKNKKLPVVLSFHDFSAICPNIQLINNGKFCYGDCELHHHQNDCHYSKSWFGNRRRLRGVFRYNWAERVAESLSKCDAYIVTSNYTKEIILKNYPMLDPEKFHNIEHGRDFEKKYSFFKEYKNGNCCDIIFFGALNEAKGCSLVSDIIRINEDNDGPLKFHIIGGITNKYKKRFSAYKNVILYGKYERDDLRNYFEEIKPTLTILPSICHETYSHALTESWAYGVPVLGSSLGAIGERIRVHDGGWTLDPVHKQQWYNKILKIIKDKKDYLQKLSNIKQIDIKSLDHMADEYCMVYRNLLKPQQKISSAAKIQSFLKKVKFKSPEKKEKNNQKRKNERHVKLLRLKLLNLGITERAFADLKKLAADDSEPYTQRLAAWELALWHANKCNREDARQCLDLLPIATQDENDPERLRRVAILKAECHDILGDLEAGKKVIQHALFSGDDADLYFAAANLEPSISGRIDYINKALELYGISKITFDPIAGRPPYDCLRPGPGTRKRPQITKDSSKVTVIVPAYNAEKTIQTALDSILAQTWTNLEVLVVDDCSTDGTVEVVKEYEMKDSRVRLIKAETNQGPYVARNLALKAATGDFVTCNDADDWSHPEKIEIQAKHLIQNSNFLANVSRWARVTNDLKFYRRGNPGFYIQLNISSLMFRRGPLMKALGYWDSVRFGADTELFNRIKKVFGKDAIEENTLGLLSFARYTEYSLTENKKFGYPGFPMGARSEYRESYLHYHGLANKLHYEFPMKSRPFPAPGVMRPVRETNSFSNRHFEVVFVSDFRHPGNAISIAEGIKAQKRKGVRTGLVQIARYDLALRNYNIDKEIRELIDGDHVQLLVYGEEITCDMLIIRDPSILQEKQRYIPEVKTGNVSVVVEQAPEKDSGSGGLVYDIRRCAKHLYEYFGKSGVWHPTDAQVRHALYKLHGDDLKAITLANEDWSNNTDVKEFQKTSRPQSGYKITNQNFDMVNDNEVIKLMDVKDLWSFAYTDTEGVAVIMPCIDTKKGMDTASILSKRAGIDCKILIIHDTLCQGFIKTLNDTAARVSTRYIVYLAEDAFPSIDWLRCAYDILGKSGKGLLAFNDGKWRGRIAAFGMVRIEWVKTLYGGLIFYPEYNAHKADNELTVIARAQGMHVYNPECTLIEYDPNKVFKENIPKDKEIFRKRFQQGFDGLVPLEKLAPMAKEYFVPWNVEKPMSAQKKTNFKQKNFSKIESYSQGAKSNKFTFFKKKSKSKALRNVSDTFALYRIIGNDLHPRHKKRQSRENLRFILENEPDFENCEKRFIINRIIDQNEEQAIIKLLKDHKREYIQIRFNPDEYRKIGFDTDCFPEPGYLSSKKFEAFDNIKKDRATAAIYRLKNNYVMNNNGARNAALRDGRRRAKWVLPWDGNCFITTKAWERIHTDVTASPHLKYFVVPMARVLDNTQLLSKGFAPAPVEEPQIIFRNDAKEEFNKAFCYGRRPKVELFWRLGVPGKWDHWPEDDPWDQKRLPESIEARQFGVAGWVARLFSGMKDLELENKQSITKRVLARNEAIITTLNHVDTMVAGMSNDKPTSFRSDILEAECLKYQAGDDPALANVVERLILDAEDALTHGPYSVTDKTTLPPSGNANDYWHPAPYWWPNPDTQDGLPYIRKDGERAPGTSMYEAESDKYDRTRLQRVFDDSFILALAWKFSGEKKYAEHGARILERFFVDPITRMTPHLKYGQVRMGHNKNIGSSTGIIEMKDMYYYLDAVRMMTAAGVVSSDDLGSFKDWLKTYLDWLLYSPQGRVECGSANNHGACYDLQVSSIASFLNDKSVLFETLARAQSRISQQFAPDGSQPDELKRKTTAHYCLFNFQSWLNLAEIASRYNTDFWSYEAPNGASLIKGAQWLLGHMGKKWPYQQIDDFDAERFYPIWFAVSAVSINPLGVTNLPDSKYKVKPRFFPHDGIRPFWNLGAQCHSCHHDSGSSSQQVSNTTKTSVRSQKAVAKMDINMVESQQVFINIDDAMKYAEEAMKQKDWSEAEKCWQEILNVFSTTAKPRVTEIADAMSAKAEWQDYRYCNICGCPLFGKMGSRKNVKCLNCGSLERTRLLYLHLQNFELITPDIKVFHLAPEKALYQAISKIIPPSNYFVTDYDPSRYSFAKGIQKFDLCNDVEGLPDNFFDLIIHSHVMEHVPCNYSFVLKHLHRALKDNGRHLCVIPFMAGYYDECFAPLSVEEAKTRFGQFDHVRRIGTNDIHNTLGRVIPIDPDYDATKLFSPEILLKANIPENCWKGLTIHTVLLLKKEDYKL